jgi:hypothetical protein
VATSQATRPPRLEPLACRAASLGLAGGATSAVGFGWQVAQGRWGCMGQGGAAFEAALFAEIGGHPRDGTDPPCGVSPRT